MVDSGILLRTTCAPPHNEPVVSLAAWQLCALVGQLIAVACARRGEETPARLISEAALAVAFGSALWVLTRPELTRALRNAAVVCLGVTPTLMWRSSNPLLFTGFDEQLHMRTLADIIASHGLFEANPLLEPSARYPGLEALTALVHQTGVPTMVAAIAVILLARLILVTVLCDTVEQITGSARAGGLAVAAYAVSPQFVFFNSQYAYQTLALPVALAAVNLTARARRAADPLPYFAGATVCLLCVAMTHHVTSFVTTVFLLVWMFAEKGPERMRVAYAALASTAATLAWAIVQRSLLQDYFGPIVDDVSAQLRGGARRAVFKDPAGTASPWSDRLLLLYFAVAVSLVVAAVALLTLRWYRRGERHLLRSGPKLLLLGCTAAIPLGLAARVLPKGGELFDRASSFLFLPFAAVVAGYAVRLWWPHPGAGPRRGARLVAVALAGGVFLGGFVLGSGPHWARLPGPYLAAADNRSMDAETLAAVEWADDALPPGSRIAADRVSSILLAARADLWPVMKGPGYINAPALYAADSWGPAEVSMARSMQLRYLYVDRRLADGLPRSGAYFFNGATGDGEQLTDSELTKFDFAPGIDLVYRHGPVSIYELTATGAPELRSGFYEDTPPIRIGRQAAAGAALGVLLALIARTAVGARWAARVTRARQAWGPAATGAVVAGGGCLLSVLLLLAGLWMTPAFLVAAVSVPAVAAMIRRRRAAPLMRADAAARAARRVSIGIVVAVPAALVVGAAAVDAAGESVVQVQQILEDPAAVQDPPVTVEEPG